MKVKSSERNRDKKTDLELFSDLKLISKTIRSNVSLEEECRQKT